LHLVHYMRVGVKSLEHLDAVYYINWNELYYLDLYSGQSWESDVLYILTALRTLEDYFQHYKLVCTIEDDIFFTLLFISYSFSAKYPHLEFHFYSLKE
jgi:hypothetical protein